MPELQHLNPDAHARLQRWRDEPFAEGDWQLVADDHVGEDV